MNLKKKEVRSITFGVRMTPAVAKNLDREAKKRKVTKSQLVEYYIIQGLETVK